MSDRSSTVKDRSYKGKTALSSNTTDLHTIITTKNQMGDKPVLVVINVVRPMMFNEFENRVDGILVRFDIGKQSIMDIIFGAYEPSGLLQVQMPANMSTVEKQFEDVSHDMECHVDTEGNVYDFS